MANKSNTKNEAKAIKDMMTKIKKSKAIIAKERDKLRELYYDLETVLESVDEGLDSLDNAMRDFDDAVDKFSECL